MPASTGSFSPMIRNIIFDWSGTLVDDLPAVWQATNHVFRSAGLEEITLETFRAEFCLPFKDFYDRFAPNIPFPQLEKWFREKFNMAQHSVEPLPYALEFLLECRAKGLRTFVLSSVLPDAYVIQAKAAGFEELIDRSYAGVLDKRLEIQNLLTSNQLQPDETLFIGDMQHDIETAKAGGVYSCGVLTGYNSLSQLRASTPDIISENLRQLHSVLIAQNWEISPNREYHSKHLQHYPIATVGALIFNDRGQILMIRTHKWSNLWGIPGGKVEYGETCTEALTREILEETNLRVKDIKFVLAQDCVKSPEFYREAHFILLNYTCHVDGPNVVTLNHEAQVSQWVECSEALQLPINRPTRLLLETVFGIST